MFFFCLTIGLFSRKIAKSQGERHVSGERDVGDEQDVSDEQGGRCSMAKVSTILHSPEWSMQSQKLSLYLESHDARRAWIPRLVRQLYQCILIAEEEPEKSGLCCACLCITSSRRMHRLSMSSRAGQSPSSRWVYIRSF